MRTGARIYIALPGGIDVPGVLGSRSTQLREGFGGFHGRVLMPGDLLKPMQADAAELPEAGLSLELPALWQPGEQAILLRALASTEHDSFTEAARAAFWTTPYAVTRQGNRQGFRLEGAPLDRNSAGELRSHGIVPGIVQVPGGGQPIIQLADSATMGGYPKIAAVIAPDFWRIAQARPGDQLRFVRVDVVEAAAAEVEEAALLEQWRVGLRAQRALCRSWC